MDEPQQHGRRSRTAMLPRLTTFLPEDLLRGIPSNVALTGYGRHWTRTPGTVGDYLLSQPTQEIDDFISHDWRTSRRVKFVTLAYIYNSTAALVGSTCVAGVLALVRLTLQQLGYLTRTPEEGLVLPDLASFVLVGPVAFLLLFFHWHGIRARLGRKTLLFVDKLCIAQHDDNLKSQGIMGLAAFLKCSRRIVVLWSPTYFSRLWCTYELATWFRYERQVSSVLFAPVGIPPLLLTLFLLVALGCVSSYINALYNTPVWSVSVPVLTMLACWVIAADVLQGLVEHIAGLQHELQRFSIQSTRCFCCSNVHRCPDTGNKLPCDREMVYWMLKQWTGNFSEDGSNDDTHLAVFNHQIRTTLQEYVTGTLPKRRLFIRYVDMLFMGFPFVWFIIDYTNLRLNRDEAKIETALYIVEGLCVWLLALPLSFTFLIRLVYWAHSPHSTGRRRYLKSRAARACLWGLLGQAVYLILHACVRVELFVSFDVLPAMLLSVAVEMALAYCVFARRAKKHSDDAGFDRKFSLSADAVQAAKSGTVTASRADLLASLEEPIGASDMDATQTTVESDRDFLSVPSTESQKRAAPSDEEGHGILVPFDDSSWKPVEAANLLTSLGRVYNVDIGDGVISTVIRL
eukprot:TRINITY_DN59631_c0_g1_i1.p1 TRINITY_DN59631_c0_g1~~TRINITY_DN59631_c0_g1_i1.p1  ORF type:complete len:629 (+),score=32.75 TRINITY_DN59631_c0_g1_i1:131-2017(+)